MFSGKVQAEQRPPVQLAAGCHVLVHDLALPERDVSHSQLHAKPGEVGRVVRDAGCGRLVLTPVMPELEDELDAAPAGVRRSYTGETVVANDLFRLIV